MTDTKQASSRRSKKTLKSTKVSKSAAGENINASPLCPICLDPVTDASEDQEGHDAVYCDGTCNGWIHRRCAGLSSAAFAALSSTSDPKPFYRPNCRLDKQSEEIEALKASVCQLSQRLSQYLSEKFSCSFQGNSSVVLHPQSTSTVDRLNLDGQPQVNTHQDGASSSRPRLPPDSAFRRPRADRKFNLIIYRINEQSKGTKCKRHIRQAADEKVIIIYSNLQKFFNYSVFNS